MASSSGRHTALAAFVVVVLVAGMGLAEAARPAPAAQSSVGEVVDSSAYMAPAVEKARETVEMLLARLPAGSSRKGPGH
uniref:Uncharacterized protein n=1 Tax=Avena sativa TaxID=4498 RepID=A0ACD5Y366_AVESA